MQNPVLGGKEKPTVSDNHRESEKVHIDSLSELTGFPVDFIKKELLIDDDNVSMAELRVSMTKYLESTMSEIEQTEA